MLKLSNVAYGRERCGFNFVHRGSFSNQNHSNGHETPAVILYICHLTDDKRNQKSFCYSFMIILPNLEQLHLINQSLLPTK